jgi:hypothetical protein
LGRSPRHANFPQGAWINQIEALFPIEKHAWMPVDCKNLPGRFLLGTKASRPEERSDGIEAKSLCPPYTNPKSFHDMRSRLFPPGCVALVIHSPLWIPPAPCQSKKSIDPICHVMTWDWY